MVKYIKQNINPRYPEYLEYLHQHISNVNIAWKSVLRPKVATLTSDEELSYIDKCILMHDKSKYDRIEFIPYLNHFYPHLDYPDCTSDYDFAWLHHQNINPHHWQYYVLIKDCGDIDILDMPLSYVCEMLCDWHSFSYKDLESTAFNWFKSNSDNMMLSNNTLDIIYKLIDVLK